MCYLYYLRRILNYDTLQSTTLSTLPLPSTIDDDGCKSSSDLSSSSTCFSGAFGAIPPATNTAEERGRRRKGERGMLTPNILCSKTPRTPLFWRRHGHGHGRWWSIVDRFEEVCCGIFFMPQAYFWRGGNLRERSERAFGETLSERRLIKQHTFLLDLPFV